MKATAPICGRTSTWSLRHSTRGLGEEAPPWNGKIGTGRSFSLRRHTSLQFQHLRSSQRKARPALANPPALAGPSEAGLRSAIWNSAKADVVLRSGSAPKIIFKVEKARLAWASPIFRDMFEIGSASKDVADTDTFDGLPVIQMSESSWVLHSLLPFCYERALRLPDLGPDSPLSGATLADLLDASIKFEMPALQTVVETRTMSVHVLSFAELLLKLMIDHGLRVLQACRSARHSRSLHHTQHEHQAQPHEHQEQDEGCDHQASVLEVARRPPPRPPLLCPARAGERFCRRGRSSMTDWCTICDAQMAARDGTKA